MINRKFPKVDDLPRNGRRLGSRRYIFILETKFKENTKHIKNMYYIF